MPFTSEKQRRFMFAEHPRIAKRWAHENPEGDEGLPTYAHGKTTSPDLKKAWARMKARKSAEKEQVEKTAGLPSYLRRGGEVKPNSYGDFIRRANLSGKGGPKDLMAEGVVRGQRATLKKAPTLTPMQKMLEDVGRQAYRDVKLPKSQLRMEVDRIIRGKTYVPKPLPRGALPRSGVPRGSGRLGRRLLSDKALLGLLGLAVGARLVGAVAQAKSEKGKKKK